MLRISLDEAYVFDILSIYEVKINNASSINKEKSLELFEKLSQEIIEQIGKELFDKILLSKEYRDLKNSNQKVFELVDRAGETLLSKQTAQENYNRYLHKIQLQSTFFKTTLTEIKI